MSSTVEQTGKIYRVLADATNNVWHKLSFWSRAKDCYTDNDIAVQTIIGAATGMSDSVTQNSGTLLATAKAVYTVNAKFPTEVTGTLTAGTASITLSSSAITTNSTIEAFTSVFGLTPTNMTVATGSVTLTFEAQTSNVAVKIRIS